MMYIAIFIKNWIEKNRILHIDQLQGSKSKANTSEIGSF